MKELKEKTESFRFQKKERLSNKKMIDALFLKGASFHLYPFAVKYLLDPRAEVDCHQVMVSISKKRFKRAVDRNRLKRLIREAYRLNRSHLLPRDAEHGFFSIAYIYVAKEMHDFAFIEQKLKDTLGRLSQINANRSD